MSAHLLPPNSTKFEQNFSLAFSRVSDIEMPARNFNDPYSALLTALPYLAWERSVDDWDKNWDEDQKRQTIDSAYFVHCHKGTIGALERALGALGFTVRVQEWFAMQPMGVPYTFKIHVESNQIGVSDIEFKQLLKVIYNNKNLRSHFVGTTLAVKSEVQMQVAAVTSMGVEFDYQLAPGGLYLDGTWNINETYVLNGVAI